MSSHLMFHLRNITQLILFSVILASILTNNSVSSLKEQVKCSASVHPQYPIVRQFATNDNNNTNNQSSSLHQIRCNAKISKDSFTNPVFDLSLGLTPTTGIFILRGVKQCSPDSSICWSDFHIPALSLRDLFSTSNSGIDHNNGDINEEDISGVSHASSIDFTCNVADSSRNSSLVVRCSDSGKIHFAEVRKYDERCSTAINGNDECGLNMYCSSGRCLCKQGFIPYPITRSETICVEKEQTTKATSTLNFNSNQSGSDRKTIQEEQEVVLTETNKQESQLSLQNQIKQKNEIGKFGKVNKYILLGFGGIFILAILIVAIIIRLRNYGEMRMKSDKNKLTKSNVSPIPVKTNCGPLLNVSNRLSDDDEEIDVRIDENGYENNKDGKMMFYDEDDEDDSEETDIDGASRQDIQADPNQNVMCTTSRVASEHSINQAGNFNYGGRQSVV
ncbi:hypothetical protein RDWZM_007744 [Blomia tropicalis]|uniref:EB domain-containing protein n=1 Tax=Blomia tropicalis TaxID=40697 RepID=A0A9Q0M343_BLOTA|nr:hypothetical protein RDWZM_007744 [Blomia tropicalis]